MCCKLMKKCCCIVVIAMITGAVFYFLCGLKGEAIQENGYLGQKLRSKREKVKQACECMKAQGGDIAREVKFAAEYSADEMKDSWKHAGEAVRNAASEIKADMSEMKESAQAAISYIRSQSKKYKIKNDFFEKHDIHIHIPEGAVPKDGPSAGITMATAIMSAVTGRKVRADLAMTGEITLRGRVLPIGGLKEKLLAAKNAGMKTVLVPAKNERDVEEISTEITKGLEIKFVTHMNEVLKEALV